MIRLLVLMASHDWRIAMPAKKAKRSASANPCAYPLLVARQFRHRTARHPRCWQSRYSTFAKARQGLTSGQLIRSVY
jgi:hypothetical protein